MTDWLPYLAIGGSAAVIAAIWIPRWLYRQVEDYFDGLSDGDLMQ